MHRKRAVNVCKFCHDHKIRCDMDITTIPCSKCSELGRNCILRNRKEYSGRKRLAPTHKLEQCTINKDHETQRSTTAFKKDRRSFSLRSQPTNSLSLYWRWRIQFYTFCRRRKPRQHFRVPAAAEKVLAPEDLEYLKIKGCFTLPNESRELLRAYFRFVHPMFPVIDAAEFSKNYTSSGLHGVNLLLLWSMFSLSASYIPLASRKAVKESYVHRAKLLFDLSQEHDKVVLVQSALLLSFWFVETEDVKQSWYWTSIAFGIAQTLGLHRSSSAQIDPVERNLWGNIWRCCLVRDVWLASGMGRPLRLDSREGDCSTLNRDEATFERMVLDGEIIFQEDEAHGFSEMWTDLNAVSNILRGALSNPTNPYIHLKALQNWIATYKNTEKTLLLTRVDRHLRLHQYAATITIACLCKETEVARRACEDTAVTVGALVADDSAIYAAPVTIPLIVPAMVHHLSTASNHAVERRTGVLKTFMQFLSSVEDNYPAAAIVERVFAAAEEMIAEKDRD